MGVLIITPEKKVEVSAAIERARLQPVSLALMAAGSVEHDSPIVTLKDRKTDVVRPASEHVLLGSYHAAISFEQQPDGIYRHLSISSLVPGTVPSRPATEQIALLFGIDRPPLAGHIWLEEFEPGHFAINLILKERTQ